ncbi:MAG: radical SAM protein [Candidatus Latescibacterota bacterium]
MAFLVSPRAIPRYIDQYGYAFSWKRLWNAGKVLMSMGISWATGRVVVWGRPFMMMVEPTNFCNLKCPLCPSGNGQMTRDRGNMGLDDFKSLIDDAGDYLVLLMLWNQGEPFINKDLLEMIRYARSKRIPTMTSTNGHYVRTREQARAVVHSGLSEMIVSLDGVDQETYEKYRVGGKLEKVITGTRLVAEAKRELQSKTPLINMQFIVFRHNEDDIAEAERLATELEADKFLIKTAQIYTDDDAATFLPEEDLFRRYEEGDEGQLQVKGQPARGCKVLWYSSMVNWNGDVAPCCFDKDVDFGMGAAFNGHDSNESTLQRIWKGRAYMDFRKKILDDRRSVDMCRNCSEGYRGMFSMVKELRG